LHSLELLWTVNVSLPDFVRQLEQDENVADPVAQAHFESSLLQITREEKRGWFWRPRLQTYFQGVNISVMKYVP
jgi:hypothetical protein